MTRPRVYAAHPMTCYFTEYERVCLDRIGVVFPGVEVLNPAGRYRTSAAWRRAWPRLARTLSALVLFADEEGCVGVGCIHEVADAILARLPVVLLGGDGRFRELGGFDLLAVDLRTPARAARPVGGVATEVSFSV